MDSERELYPCGSLSHLYRAFSSGFLLTNHFDLLSSKSVFCISQNPLICSCISQPSWIAPKRPMGKLDIQSPFSIQGAFKWGRFSWFQEWEICGLLSLIWWAQTLLLVILILIFWSFYPLGMNSSCSTWGPSISCLKIIRDTYCSMFIF